MSSVFSKALHLLTGSEDNSTLLKMPKKRLFKAFTERELIQLESEIGANLFGPIPAGNRREFFCLDKKTWIWYEEYIDTETGKMLSHTVRYEIHENGILKAYDGAQYTFLEGDELQNLADSISMYRDNVARKVYHLDPKTGRKLPN